MQSMYSWIHGSKQNIFFTDDEGRDRTVEQEGDIVLLMSPTIEVNFDSLKLTRRCPVGFEF